MTLFADNDQCLRVVVTDNHQRLRVGMLHVLRLADRYLLSSLISGLPTSLDNKVCFKVPFMRV
jgi:hypothetical protein